MHNDVKRLIEFSIENDQESAIESFPMFSLPQIQGLYDISISQRLHLLHEWGVEDSAAATSCGIFTILTIRPRPRRSGNRQGIRRTSKRMSR